MVILEIDFMREIGRVHESGERIYRELSKRSGLAISETPFAEIVFEASAQSWTKDPFDRIIVAEAAVYGALSSVNYSSRSTTTRIPVTYPPSIVT